MVTANLKSGKAVLPFTLLTGLFLTNCSDERRFHERLVGTWDVTVMRYEQFHSGECGKEEGVSSGLSWEDVGTIELTNSEANEAETEEVAYHGKIEFDFSDHYSDGRPILNDVNVPVTYRTRKDLNDHRWLLMHNSVDDVTEMWSIDYLDRHTFYLNHVTEEDECGGYRWVYLCKKE